MKTITLQKKELDFNDYLLRPASEDYGDLISGDTVIQDEAGKKLLLYFRFSEDTENLRLAVRSIKYNVTQRSRGLITRSRIFGFEPAQGVRKPYCSATALSTQNPLEHGVITRFGVDMARVYKEYLPEAAAEHEATASEKIMPEWRIPNTPFTSGIINQNNQLNYHFDTGNFQGIYSNMVVLKSNCAGGYLHLPEYGVAIECADNTMVMFDGQSILHGVTPIKFYSKDAYRYSLVYYTLQQAWKCEDVTKELAKIRNRRTKLERFNATGEVVDASTAEMKKRRESKEKKFKEATGR